GDRPGPHRRRRVGDAGPASRARHRQREVHPGVRRDRIGVPLYGVVHDARAFARVVADAAAYTNAHRAETAPLVAQAGKLNVAVVEKMTRWTAATTVSLPSIQLP